MSLYVKEHDHLPFIIKTFEELPKAIADESSFVETIDYQLESIKVYFNDTVTKALALQSSMLTEVPGAQPLGLPNAVSNNIMEIADYL